MSRINAIIDYLDAIEGVPDGDPVWRATRAYSEALGAAYVGMGVIDCREARPEWTMISLSPHLMQDYLAAGLHLHDPCVAWCAAGAAGWSWRTDAPLVAQGPGVAPADPGHDAALRLLAEHRIGLIAGLPGPLARGGTRDLFCYGEHSGERAVADAGGEALMRVIAAVAWSRIGAPPRGHPDAPVYERDPLSPREKDVLRLLAAGRMNARIAEDLGVAEVTVRLHVRTARRKLGAATREQALAIALTRGLLDL